MTGNSPVGNTGQHSETDDTNNVAEVPAGMFKEILRMYVHAVHANYASSFLVHLLV